MGFAPKQTKESSDWHLRTPTEMNATHRVTPQRSLRMVKNLVIIGVNELGKLSSNHG